MKLNELVCPTCGLKCMTDASHTTCDSCMTFFYASQSRSVDCPQPLNPGITITWPQIVPTPQPIIEATPIWIAPFGPPGSLYGPTVTCETTLGGTSEIDQSQFRVWN